MIHRCKIQCHAIDPDKLDLMGLEDDKGKWLPFSFHMGVVVAAKLSTDDDEQISYGCTSIFTEQGDTYIIDTPYEEFEEKFIRFNEDESGSSRNANL